MGQLVAQERPIDAPTPSVYIKMVEAKLLLPGSDSTSCRRVLDIIRGWKEDATHKNIKHDVEEIAMALRTHSKLIRDAVLPLEYIVQCPTAVDALEYMVLITSDGGQILSTSGQVSAAVPFPSSTQELRTVLPLKDEWESIKERCLTDSQWGSCLSQLLQVEFDNPKIDNDYKRVISRRQMHLAKKTATLPPSLFLHNVELPGNTYHCESGGFADIAKATINGTPVCLKILREYSDKQDDRVKKGKAFFREVLLWSRLKHPNILQFLGASEIRRFMLISPWMENGNLRHFLQTHPDHDRLMACSEISSGLSYLHGLSIHHKDINAANVLVKDDEHCCLADFGLSSIAGSQRLESKSYAGEGTCRWKALELIASDVEEIYVALDFGAADVWAFACTVSEIYTGNIPFKHIKEDISVGLAILNGKKPELPGAGTHGISEGFRNLVWSCWDEAPERRPMLSEINDFLKSEIASCDAPAMVNPQPIGEDFEEHDVDTTDPFQVMEQSVTMDELSGGHSSKLPNDHLPPRRISSAAGGLHDRQSSENHISWDPPRGLKIEVPNPTSASSGSAVKAIGGLLTPTTNHNSPVALASLLTGLEALAEEPSAINYMDQPGSTLPGICTAAKMLTPPETPVMLPETQSPQLTPSPTRLSPLSPVFWPGPGVRIKTHRLSLEAAVFQPSRGLSIPSLVPLADADRPTTRHSSLLSPALNPKASEFTPITRLKPKDSSTAAASNAQKFEVMRPTSTPSTRSILNSSPPSTAFNMNTSEIKDSESKCASSALPPASNPQDLDAMTLTPPHSIPSPLRHSSLSLSAKEFISVKNAGDRNGGKPSPPSPALPDLELWDASHTATAWSVPCLNPEAVPFSFGGEDLIDS